MASKLKMLCYVNSFEHGCLTCFIPNPTILQAAMSVCGSAFIPLGKTWYSTFFGNINQLLTRKETSLDDKSLEHTFKIAFITQLQDNADLEVDINN